MRLGVLRLGLGGLRHRWGASALTFALLAIGSAALLVSFQLREVAEQPWQRTFEATNGAHIIAFGPTPDIARLAAVDGVVEASGPAPVVITSMDVRGDTYGLRVIGFDAPPVVERPAVTDGRWMRTDGELVLERSLADALDVVVGNTVDLRGLDGVRTFDVVGVAVSAREAPYPENQPGEGYVRLSDLGAIQPDDERWSWIVSARIDDPSAADSIARQAAPRLPGETLLRTYDSRVEDASDRHRTTTLVLQTFSLLLLLAVAFVIATLVSTRLLDRAEELGVLKAVGFTPAQVAAVVGVEQLLVASAAALAGAFAGSLLAPRIVRDSSELLGSVPVEVSPVRIVMTVLAVLTVVVLAIALPTWRIARACVLRSLGSWRTPSTINRLALALPLRRPLLVALGVRQLLARPGRSGATALALTLTISSLVAGLAFEATVANEDAAEQQALIDLPPDTRSGQLAPGRPDPVAVVDATREQLRPIVHGFNAVLVAVAVVNLLATALLSLRRHRRDIALTRAIGLTPRQVSSSVVCADGVVGLTAAIVGVPLGSAMFLGVYWLVNGDTELAALPPPWQLAIVPAACVAAVMCIAAIPVRFAAGQSVTAGLQRE